MPQKKYINDTVIPTSYIATAIHNNWAVYGKVVVFYICCKFTNIANLTTYTLFTNLPKIYYASDGFILSNKMTSIARYWLDTTGGTYNITGLFYSIPNTNESYYLINTWLIY